MSAKPTPTLTVKRTGDYWQVLDTGAKRSGREFASCLRKEDAEAIVSAVNSHEALLKIAREVAGPGRHIDSPKCFHCQATAALARAEDRR